VGPARSEIPRTYGTSVFENREIPFVNTNAGGGSVV
jgi:hypothetical protein